MARVPVAGSPSVSGGRGKTPIIDLPLAVRRTVAGASAHLVPSGGDDSAQMIAALTNFAPFVSPYVMLGPGTFLWNTSVPAFARSLAARVRGAGQGQTIIKLSAAAPRAFDFNRVADQDTFQNIELSDFTVDCNNVNTGKSEHVVLGNLVGGTWTQRLNFAKIKVRRVNTINVPTILAQTTTTAGVTVGATTVPVVSTAGFPSGGGITLNIGGGTFTYTGVTANSFTGCTAWTGTGTLLSGTAVIAEIGRQNVSIVSQQLLAQGSETLTTLTDITVEDCDFQGGMVGVFIAGAGSATTDCNVFLDRIRVSRVNWDSLVTPTVAMNGAGVQIGGGARGGYYLVDSCTLKNSWDVGVELDGGMLMVNRDCTSEDAISSGFLAANFNTPTDQPGQVWISRGCVVKMTNVSTPPGNFGFVPWTTPYVGLGHAIISECSYVSKSAAIWGRSGLAISVAGALSQLTVDKFSVVIDAIADTSSSAQSISFIDVQPTTDCIVTLRKIYFKLAGSTSNGTLTPSYIVLGNATNGKVTTIDLDGIDVDSAITGVTAGNTVGTIAVGAGVVGGLYQGLIRRFNVKSWSGDTLAKAILARGASSIGTRLTIEDCDFTRNTGFDTVGLGGSKTVFRNNAWGPNGPDTGLPNATVAVPASGSAVAASPFHRNFYVTAGASTVTMAIQNGPSPVIPASTFATIRVPANQTVTPTYTAAPTWVVEGE